MKLKNYTLIVVLILTGCAVNNSKFFSKIESSSDKSYGFTAENPITIKNSDLRNSIDASYYFLSRLRSKKGNKLKLIQRYSVENPNFKKPLLNWKNRYSGEPISYGNGPFLDLYILCPENETDTLNIYINPYLKGVVMIPYGLKFEKE